MKAYPKIIKMKSTIFLTLHKQIIFFFFYTREHLHFWSEMERFFLTCYVSQVSFINVVLNRENLFLPVEYLTVYTKFELRKTVSSGWIAFQNYYNKYKMNCVIYMLIYFMWDLTISYRMFHWVPVSHKQNILWKAGNAYATSYKISLHINVKILFQGSFSCQRCTEHLRCSLVLICINT